MIDHTLTPTLDAEDHWPPSPDRKSVSADAVNHPTHYQTADGGKEVIEVIEELGLGFHLGNALKYLARSGRKGGSEQEIEDMRKARWYVRRYFELTKVDPCRPNDMR